MPNHVPLPEPLQDRPFTYRDGRRAGATQKRMRGPDVASPFRGTRDPRNDDSVRGLCQTYATQMNENAFFSSMTAAQLMSIPLPPRLANSDALHVAIVSPHRGLQGVRIIGHKVQLMGGDSWTRDGLVMSSPSRVWCELGIWLSVPELVAAGDFIIRRGSPLATHLDLMEAAERYPDRRGKRKLRAALPLLNDSAESPMESQLRAILTLGGIGGLVANYPIRVGSYSYRLDLAIPDRKIAIEYHGDYHRDPAQWRRDLTRRSRIEGIEWTYIEVNGDDMHTPVELVARVKAQMR